MGAAALPIGMIFMKGAEAIAGYSEASNQANALREKAAYEKGILEQNKRLAENSAADVMQQGEQVTRDVMREERRVQGGQRASYAAQGVELDSTTVTDVARETAMNAAVDMATIRSNARRQAWGYKMQALNYQKQADFGVVAADKAASNTLLTAGLRSLAKLGEGAYNLSRSGEADQNPNGKWNYAKQGRY